MATKKTKLLKKDTLLRAFLPKGTQYDDVKRIHINLKNINGTSNSVVGAKKKDIGNEGEIDVNAIAEFIMAVVKKEGLKYNIEGSFQGEGKDKVYSEVDITITK